MKTVPTLPLPIYGSEPVDLSEPLPLESGDRLTRVEFERRYSRMKRLKKAELLRGIVYMASPVRVDRHGAPHALLIGCLVFYASATPGVQAADNSTVRLSDEDEPQPDALLYIPRDRGGQAAIDVDGYLDAAPELAAEVASTSASYDAHVKLEIYQSHGVKEYLIWRTADRALDWYALREGRYEPIPADDAGIIRSLEFPGLWLDVASLLAGDAARAFEVLQQGLKSEAHDAFVERLNAVSSI